MLSVDKLYEAFMDIGDYSGEEAQDFAFDIYDLFGGKLDERGWDKEEWAAKYTSYLPAFDPAQTYLAERKRDISFDKEMDVMTLANETLNRVYDTELDTLSTALGKEMAKGKSVAGKTGIRSGAIESAIEETREKAEAKAQNLGDRLVITEEQNRNKYNKAMADAALVFDKREREEKEEFYDRTMASIMRLEDKGAFGCPKDLPYECFDGSCAATKEECPLDPDVPACCTKTTYSESCGDLPGQMDCVPIKVYHTLPCGSEDCDSDGRCYEC